MLAQQVAEQRSVRNYHHFFPKAYLSAANPKAESNLIANIALIDGYWNKHRIGKKPPSTYISKFAETNKSLRKTLHTHLIGDMKSYCVTSINSEDRGRVTNTLKSEANGQNARLINACTRNP